MNIFKILANGDGTINEANVSAFLGYLLDPYADHGLGFLFIEKFIHQIDDSINVNKFDYEILFEQAFKENGKSKQIIDIVILCFDNNQGTGKESIAKNLLSKNRKLESIFLVENKIRKPSKTNDQLTNQFEATINVLNDLGLNVGEYIVYSVYITPNIEGFEDEFASLNRTENAIHLAWKKNSTNEAHSIIGILKDIIHSESKGEIEAINEYTKHTIKSFIQFIGNNFKSEQQEEKERKTFTIDDSKVKESIRVTYNQDEINIKRYVNNMIRVFDSEGNLSHVIVKNVLRDLIKNYHLEVHETDSSTTQTLGRDIINELHKKYPNHYISTLQA